MSFTPHEIARKMFEADTALEELTDQFIWFKAQRDWWRGELDFHLAAAKVFDDGPVSKSKEAALVQVTKDFKLYINGMSLPAFVRVCDASFELIQKRYDYVHDHLMTLMAINKNVMQDYNRSNTYG